MIFFPLQVHCNDDYLTNEISLFHLIQVNRVHIALDSNSGFGFHTTYKDEVHCFAPFENGLCYFDTREESRSIEFSTNKTILPYSLLQTANNNKKFYADR